MEAKNNLHILVPLAIVVFAMCFLMWAGGSLITMLGAHDWCSAAIGAGKDAKVTAAPTIDSLTACVGLLTLQVRALTVDSYIALGVIALCVLVLVVIAIAGAKLNFSVNGSGATVDMSANAAPPASSVEVKSTTTITPAS